MQHDKRLDEVPIALDTIKELYKMNDGIIRRLCAQYGMQVQQVNNQDSIRVGDFQRLRHVLGISGRR